ncbi:MAG TPA: arsenic resistance N-acetyltransferase ArsN2 [Thermoanaerobaculia bacterium]|nr:arsenic resistance N-acetyltransferase ArsN2 [Thermoanaerobaculia bacterium]
MNAPAYDVRPARRDDFASASTLLSESKLPLEGFADHFGNALVATRGARVVGVVELEVYGNAALLRSLVVAPSERGARLGERLTREALRLARDRAAADVYLLTETAERFFPRFGFAVEDRVDAPEALRQSEEFRTACPASAVMMHARLGA